MAAKVSPKRRKGAPGWATDPFQNFINEVERLEHMVRISIAGIGMLRGAPKVIEVLMKVKDDHSAEKIQQLEAARKDAELAKQEVDLGFPVLHAWAVVALWAHLEATIRTFIAAWLRHKRTAWRIEPIRRLRIRLGEYETIPRNQRHRFVVEMLEKELGASLRGGVNRFETMLGLFGLSGELPARLQREIFELNQVRNLIVHSASKIDRRFTDACPWLKAEVGGEFRVTHEMFARYSGVAMTYISLIICRSGEKFGVDMSENRDLLFEQINTFPD